MRWASRSCGLSSGMESPAILWLTMGGSPGGGGVVIWEVDSTYSRAEDVARRGGMKSSVPEVPPNSIGSDCADAVRTR